MSFSSTCRNFLTIFLRRDSKKKKAPRIAGGLSFLNHLPFRSSLDDVHVHHGDRTVKIASHKLFSVASHHTLARSEIVRGVDRRGDDERHVRGVDVSGLEEAPALVSHEDLRP